MIVAVTFLHSFYFYSLAWRLRSLFLSFDASCRLRRPPQRASARGKGSARVRGRGVLVLSQLVAEPGEFFLFLSSKRSSTAVVGVRPPLLSFALSLCLSLSLSLSLLPTPPLPPSLTLCAFKAHASSSSPKTKKCTQPLHASFPKFASLYPPKESAAALVTALGRATALATIVHCVWVFAAAAVVRDDHKGPAELAEEKRKKQGSKKRA